MKIIPQRQPQQQLPLQYAINNNKKMELQQATLQNPLLIRSTAIRPYPAPPSTLITIIINHHHPPQHKAPQVKPVSIVLVVTVAIEVPVHGIVGAIIAVAVAVVVVES